MFNNILYKLEDGMAMGLPLRPTMANVFLSFYELKWLEQHPNELKTVFYRIYVDDIFVLFKSAEQHPIIKLNHCLPKVSWLLSQG